MLHIFLTGKKSGLQAGQFKTLLLWSHFAVIDAICVLELSLLNMQGLFWKRCHLKATISKGTAIPSEMLAFTLRAVDKLDDPFFLLTCSPCSIENKTGVWEICKSHYLFYWHFRQCPNMFRNCMIERLYIVYCILFFLSPGTVWENRSDRTTGVSCEVFMEA